jgi:hypothetical protein
MPMSGPSATQTQEAGSSQDFSNSLQAAWGQNFGAESSILGNLNNELTPIAEAGPNQEGFNASELSSLNSSAISSNATNYKNASAAVSEGRAGAGGNTYAPSGGDQQVQAQIASNASENLSNTENQIQQTDAAVGRSTWQAAEGGLQGVAAAYNPNATAGAATSAGGQAYSQANENNAQSQAWMGDVAGLVGGLGGAAIGAFGRSATNTGNSNNSDN